MACRAPPIWCSIILIVIGIIIAVLAVLPWFLIPNAVEDAVTEGAVLTDEKDDGFKEFKDQTKNPLIFNCYFWNITNPAAVKGGAKPILASVGPYVWKKYAHRINITFASDKNTFQYREWNEYIYDPVLSGGRNASTEKFWTINTAWVAGIPRAGLNEGLVGASISTTALTGLKSAFADNINVTIQYLNSAWATTLFGAFSAPSPGGLGGDYAQLLAVYENDVPPNVWPFADASGVFKDIIDGENVTTFYRLFNASVDFSLMSTKPGHADRWIDCSSPVLFAGDLSLAQIQAICAWRSVLKNPPTGFKRATDLGGVGYLRTLGAVATAQPAPTGSLSAFLPSPFIGDETSFQNVENNIQYIHWVFHKSAVAGIFGGNASIIDLPGSTARASLLNTRPEVGHFVAYDAATFIMGVEFAGSTPDLANLGVLIAPSALTSVHARWIFSTFTNTFALPALGPTARAGPVTFAALVLAVPLFLATHPVYGPLYATRNFVNLAAAWNSTSFPVEFEVGINNAVTAGLVKGFPPGTGTILKSLGLFSPSAPAFTFPQLFQVYLWAKYQFVVTFGGKTLDALNSGLLVQATAEGTMFGRPELFFSQLSPGTVVPGIWGDYTLELGVKNNFIETYKTGNDDPKNFRAQLTYNGNSSLAQYFPLLTPAPVVTGSSLTFIGPYRLVSKNGIKKAEDEEKLLLWTPDVVRELQLIYQSETSLKGIDLYRFEANARYKTVVQSTQYRNPYDFVMDNSIKYNGGVFPFYLTFPGFTLVKETEKFNGGVVGVEQDPKNWILTWDFEPITGLAMRASAPLQLSLPLGTPSFKETFGVYSGRVTNTTVPAWYIIRTNQITDDQASDWKKAVGGALAVQAGLTIAMAVIGFVLFAIGVGLLIWRLVAGKSGEMTEFELRN